MAAWQFDLFLIPKGESMPAATEDGLDIPILPTKSVRYAQENLVSSLGQPWFMLEDWIVCGVENGTRVDFHFDDIGGVEIKVRLDASENRDGVVEAICAMALRLECTYFDIQGKQFIDPLPEAMLQSLAASKAAKFVRSPRNYVTALPAV